LSSLALRANVPTLRLAMGQQRPPIDVYPEIVPARQAASNLRTIGRFWWVIALCVLLASVAGYEISARQPGRYDATAKVLLTNSEPVNVLERRTPGPSLDPERDLNTNVDLVKLTTVASRVRAELHLPLSVTTLLREVKAAPEGTSNVISITVRDRVPARAKAIANAFARRYIVVRRQQAQAIYKQAALLAEAQLKALTPAESAVRGADLRARLHQFEIAGSLQTGNAQLIDPAMLPLTPSSPRPKMTAIIAGFVGLLVGVMFALALGVIPPLHLGVPVSVNGNSAGTASATPRPAAAGAASEREREQERERARERG
jgi:tyrosine-protein kinase